MDAYGTNCAGQNAWAFHRDRVIRQDARWFFDRYIIEPDVTDSNHNDELMSDQSILFDVEAGVARITLNRPDVLNSFDGPMADALQTALRNAAADEGVRAVLLTGAGRAFCAGQDLAAVLPKEGAPPVDLGEVVERQYNPIVRAIRTIEKPFVCAVNGVAAGAGANLALACDIVVASEKASFIQSFSKIGLIPDSGGTFFLPRLIGLPRATALMMLADKVRAADAEAMGMIYRVLPPETLIAEAFKLAAHLATQPTFGLGLIKRAIHQAFTNDLDAHLDLERELQHLAGQSEDYAEGVNAFLEKRPAVFIGK